MNLKVGFEDIKSKLIKDLVQMCEKFKFESELKVSFCLSGSSLHEDHQVYVYVSTFYQLINSHIKRTQWQYRAVKSRNQLSQPKYGWPNCFFGFCHIFGHHWPNFIPSLPET